MKALHGARLNDMRPFETEQSTFAQSAFRWVLNGGLVDSLVVTMQSTQEVDEYLVASGAGKPTGQRSRCWTVTSTATQRDAATVAAIAWAAARTGLRSPR